MKRAERKSDEEQFNPNVDVRMAARLPVALFSYPRLSEGAKLLYARLAYYRGPQKRGFCAPSLRMLAEELAVHINTIENWLKELIQDGFIERKQRGNGRPAECIFLQHPCFSDYAEMRSRGKTASQKAVKLKPESDSQSTVKLNNSSLTKSGRQLHNPLGSASQFLPQNSPQSVENADSCATENHHQNQHIKPTEKKPSSQPSVDDEKPKPKPTPEHAPEGQKYASPEAELRDIYRTKTGEEISRDLKQRIWDTVETRGVTHTEFMEELRSHVPNEWKNPAGFLTDFAKKINRKKAGSTATVEIPARSPKPDAVPIAMALATAITTTTWQRASIAPANLVRI